MNERTHGLYQEKIAFFEKDIHGLETNPEVFLAKLERTIPLQIASKQNDMEMVKMNPRAVEICREIIKALEDELREVKEHPAEIVAKHLRAWKAQLEQTKKDFQEFTQRKN